MKPALARPTLHPRNRHQGHYDFARLVKTSPALSPYTVITPRGDTSIDFSNPGAVRELNRAILRCDYDIAHWDLPDGTLCPPIPGRADYLHGLADLLAEGDGTIPRGMSIRVLDIGVGASCIYPLLGHAEYGWRFVGSDIDARSLKVATAIVDANRLDKAIALRLQPRRDKVFRGVVREDDRFDLTLCNPPFHASAREAASANQRKLRQLGTA
ncbi:MAG: RlmF-related methyltransferase, partial [Lysobacter sp.]